VYDVSHDNVFAFKNPAVANEVRGALTEVLREGARTLPARASILSTVFKFAQ
jgi:hypothetical protein